MIFVYMILILINVLFAYNNFTIVTQGGEIITVVKVLFVQAFAIGWCSAFFVVHIIRDRLDQR